MTNVYGPTGRFGKTYDPFSFVVARDFKPKTMTATPRIGVSNSLSYTTPRIEPVAGDCA